MESEKIYKLFEELQEHRTLINLRVIGVEGYNRLTMITGLRRDGEPPQFSVDPPEGFDEAVVGRGAWKLHFQLTGPDKLDYKFTTEGGRYEGREIWIDFPQEVERVQRRRHFRVQTVPGTRAAFKLEGDPRVMDVVNISLGGMLGIFVRRKGESGLTPRLKTGTDIHLAAIACPLEGETLYARIDKMQVVRVEEDRANERLRYAFQFIRIDRKEVKALTAIVYALQRFFLRNR